MKKKITIKGAILNQLSELAPLTSGSIIIPINRYVLIQTDGKGGALLTTSNSACFRHLATSHIECEEAIDICLEQDKLFSILKLHGDIEGTVQYKEGEHEKKGKLLPYKMSIKSQKGKSNLPVAAGDDFSVLPDLSKYKLAFSASAHLLQRAISSASKCVLKDQYGSPHECIHLSSRAEKIIVGGTNRANLYLVAVAGELSQEFEFMIPASGFSKLTGFLPNTDQLVEVYLSERSAIFALDNSNWLSVTLQESVPRENGEISLSLNPTMLSFVSNLTTDACLTVETHKLGEIIKHLTDLIDLNHTQFNSHAIRMRVTPSGIYLHETDTMEKYASEIFLECGVDGISEEEVIKIDGIQFREGLKQFNDVAKIEFSLVKGQPMKITDRDEDPDYKDIFISAQVN
jgi:DNA polymerase III sliding clamp (beta) subunit (PCNA family)